MALVGHGREEAGRKHGTVDAVRAVDEVDGLDDLGVRKLGDGLEGTAGGLGDVGPVPVPRLTSSFSCSTSPGMMVMLMKTLSWVALYLATIASTKGLSDAVNEFQNVKVTFDLLEFVKLKSRFSGLAAPSRSPPAPPRLPGPGTSAGSGHPVVPFRASVPPGRACSPFGRSFLQAPPLSPSRSDRLPLNSRPPMPALRRCEPGVSRGLRGRALHCSAGGEGFGRAAAGFRGRQGRPGGTRHRSPAVSPPSGRGAPGSRPGPLRQKGYAR